MGFPWKKVKSTNRISQMVKDQIHHRKNVASPLVVETGFPTSLIDLIVNHRDRFKKPSHSPRFSKRKPPPPPPPPSRTGDPVFAPPSQSQSQSPLPPPPAPSPTPPRSQIPVRDAHEVNDAAGISGGSREGGGEGSDSNKALAAVLKIFLLVVLTLGAKKFAVGITMSAFVLFFLDYLARNVFKCQYLLPYSEVQEKLRLMTFQIRTRVLRLEEEIPVLIDAGLLNCPIEEIQIVQPICNSDPSIENAQYTKEEMDDPEPERTKSMAELIEEDEESYELSESKRGKSCRAKIRSKMKKLFPKRIGIRKTGKDLILEINPTREYKFPIAEINEESETGLEPDNMASSIMPEAITGSHELCEGEVESIDVTKPDRVERDENYGFLVLILVALVGLVVGGGGRIYALIFTLTWCFLSKLGEAIRRCVKAS